MKSKIKDLLAIIGGLWVAWEILHYLTSAGIVHLTGLGGG